MFFLCPSRTLSYVYASTFQTLIDLSPEPDIRSLQFDVFTRASTSAWCPLKTFISSNVLQFHSFNV